MAWKRAKSPKRWDPENIGEELIGAYKGAKVKDGIYGEYVRHYVKCEDRTYYVTGTVITELLIDADIAIGAMIKIVWQGWKPCGPDMQYRDFELFVDE